MTTLKNVLIINALSSGATGLILAIFPSYIAGLFGAAQTMPFVAVGIFLIIFAAIVFTQGRKNPPSTGWIKLIIVLDTLWVIESLMIIAAEMFGLTAIGYYSIGAVAFWVALMAFLQLKGLRQLNIAG
ncbi:hypothetical protein [Dyadobacter pollutisoli]|uniref:Uncharacterized protein n=1 Tax=Dyadobacter pollutisoli TaxID=2910158 RepID=A0A9E8N9R1_9BACT|nr:hypothetical protein [Dyadobacter pollutisoli]WAC11948.1 hypothetical protein ON006_29995 [Dyadobacter pollutisoli]